MTVSEGKCCPPVPIYSYVSISCLGQSPLSPTTPPAPDNTPCRIDCSPNVCNVQRADFDCMIRDVVSYANKPQQNDPDRQRVGIPLCLPMSLSRDAQSGHGPAVVGLADCESGPSRVRIRVRPATKFSSQSRLRGGPYPSDSHGFHAQAMRHCRPCHRSPSRFFDQ